MYVPISHDTAIFGTGQSARALAISTDACIVSPLRFADWVLCNDPELDVPSKLAVDACERIDGKVWVPAPELPTLCDWPSSYRVEGRVTQAGTTPETLVPLDPPLSIQAASVTAEPGVYQVEWSVKNGKKDVSGPYVQIMTVAPAYPVIYGAAESTAYDFVTITATGTPLGLDGDAEATVTLPFAFPYYGGSYTALRVGANGAIRFNGGDVDANNSALPTSQLAAPDIALFWDDLAPDMAGDVYVEHDAAYQRFIVSWEAVPHAPNVGAGSFQVHLYETGRIEFHYADADFGSSTVNAGRSATIGIQDHVAGLTTAHVSQISFNTPWSTMNGQARAFQPECDTP